MAWKEFAPYKSDVFLSFLSTNGVLAEGFECVLPVGVGWVGSHDGFVGREG